MPLQPSKPKPKPNSSRLLFTAIGTSWSIDRYDDQMFSDVIKQLILNQIEVFDKNYSRFRADSLVTKMSQQAGKYRLPADAKSMLDLYQELYQQTNGLMTPLIGQTLSDAGYDASYSLKSKPLQTPPSWESVLTYSYPNLELHQPVLLDLGALGKGYLVDQISYTLSKQGITAYCINAGGDLYYQTDTNQTLSVGLENPAQLDEVIGVATIRNQALCGSAGNRRRWGTYHHILNPQSLTSPKHLAAVWVIANSCMLADALTTALFFMSPDDLKQYYQFAYAILNNDGKLQYSPDFPATFFTA